SRRQKLFEKWSSQEGVPVDHYIQRTIRQLRVTRLGEPSDIAEVLDFHSSDRSRWIQGAILRCRRPEIRACDRKQMQKAVRMAGAAVPLPIRLFVGGAPVGELRKLQPSSDFRRVACCTSAASLSCWCHGNGARTDHTFEHAFDPHWRITSPRCTPKGQAGLP